MDSKLKGKKLNLYFLLGVKKDSSVQEIKSAYKKLALKWHPDKNQGTDTTEKIKEINESYQTHIICLVYMKFFI